MNKASKTHMLIAGVVGINILLIGMYAYLFQQIQVRSKEVAEWEKKVVQEEHDTRMFAQFATIIKDIEPAKEQLGQYFVGTDSIVDFLESLEYFAEISGVVSTFKNNKTPESLNFSITYEGNFDNALYFIALVESLPYNMTIDGVFLDRVTAGSDNWRGGMNITLPGSGKD